MTVRIEHIKPGTHYIIDNKEVEVTAVAELSREGLPGDFGGWGAFPAVTYRERGSDKTSIMLLSTFATKAYPSPFAVTKAMTPQAAMLSTLAAIEEAAAPKNLSKPDHGQKWAGSWGEQRPHWPDYPGRFSCLSRHCLGSSHGWRLAPPEDVLCS